MKSNLRKKLLIGFGMGAIAPALASPLVAFILFSIYPPRHSDEFGFIGRRMSFWEFYLANMETSQKLSIFISLCAIVNLIIFFFFLKKKDDVPTARGVILATLIYAAVMFYIKMES